MVDDHWQLTKDCGAGTSMTQVIDICRDRALPTPVKWKLNLQQSPPFSPALQAPERRPREFIIRLSRIISDR
jgi:hypothetical protein